MVQIFSENVTMLPMVRIPLENETGLWMMPARVTVRVVLTITMDSTALLLVWALLELIFRRDSTRDSVLFVLNICYVSSLIFSICFFNVALYMAPGHKACPAVVGLAHLAVLCSMAWIMLASLQRLLMSQGLGPEQISSQARATVIVVFYMITGYGLPCISLVTLMAQFYLNQYTGKTMCWLSQDAAWWLVLPLSAFTGGSFAIATVAFGYFSGTSAIVRCHTYSCFILNVLFSFCQLLIQVDVEWPSVSNGYLLMGLMVLHNILVWLHLTDTLTELCPCAHQFLGDNMSEMQPVAIQMVATSSAVPSPLHLFEVDRPGQAPERFQGEDAHYQTGSQNQDSLRPGSTQEQPQSSRQIDFDSNSRQLHVAQSTLNFDDDMGASDEDVFQDVASLEQIRLDTASCSSKKSDPKRP